MSFASSANEGHADVTASAALFPDAAVPFKSAEKICSNTAMPADAYTRTAVEKDAALPPTLAHVISCRMKSPRASLPAAGNEGGVVSLRDESAVEYVSPPARKYVADDEK